MLIVSFFCNRMLEPI